MLYDFINKADIPMQAYGRNQNLFKAAPGEVVSAEIATGNELVPLTAPRFLTFFLGRRIWLNQSEGLSFGAATITL